MAALAKTVIPKTAQRLRSPEIQGPTRDDIPALVDHIVQRYHHAHLRELPYAIGLARHVEQVYAADPDCPLGLADQLTLLSAALEAHQWREETMLFPLLRIGTPNCLRFATRRMAEDHVGVEIHLMKLQQFTKRYRPSFEAPFCWQALSVMCRKLEADMLEHARLEHEVLYALLLN